MSATAQERLALGAVALLLATGVGARTLRPALPAPEWGGAAVAEGDAALLARLRAATTEEVAREEARARPLAAGERIDPNEATPDELARLPEVGPALAERIVARREARGPFRTLADLDSVSGVGPAMLAAIAPHVTLLPAPSSSSRSPTSSSASLSSSSPDRRRASDRDPSRGSLAYPSGEMVDLNRAGASELDALPGIGPALAERIVAWRAAHGPFDSVDALAEVPGIGARTVERLRPLVRASP